VCHICGSRLIGLHRPAGRGLANMSLPDVCASSLLLQINTPRGGQTAYLSAILTCIGGGKSQVLCSVFSTTSQEAVWQFAV
jgi:hypothetical protein